MMVTGLQLPLQPLALDGIPGKPLPVESETTQPISFGELLKLKERQLQQEQQVNPASIAAALMALQTRPILPTILPNLEVVDSTPSPDGSTQPTVAATGNSPSSSATQPTNARLTTTEASAPVTQTFSTPQTDSAPQSTATTESQTVSTTAFDPAVTAEFTKADTSKASTTKPATMTSSAKILVDQAAGANAVVSVKTSVSIPVVETQNYSPATIKPSQTSVNPKTDVQPKVDIPAFEASPTSKPQVQVNATPRQMEMTAAPAKTVESNYEEIISASQEGQQSSNPAADQDINIGLLRHSMARNDETGFVPATAKQGTNTAAFEPLKPAATIETPEVKPSVSARSQSETAKVSTQPAPQKAQSSVTDKPVQSEINTDQLVGKSQVNKPAVSSDQSFKTTLTRTSSAEIEMPVSEPVVAQQDVNSNNKTQPISANALASEETISQPVEYSSPTPVNVTASRTEAGKTDVSKPKVEVPAAQTKAFTPKATPRPETVVSQDLAMPKTVNVPSVQQQRAPESTGQPVEQVVVKPTVNQPAQTEQRTMPAQAVNHTDPLMKEPVLTPLESSFSVAASDKVSTFAPTEAHSVNTTSKPVHIIEQAVEKSLPETRTVHEAPVTAQRTAAPVSNADVRTNKAPTTQVDRPVTENVLPTMQSDASTVEAPKAGVDIKSAVNAFKAAEVTAEVMKRDSVTAPRSMMGDTSDDPETVLATTTADLDVQVGTKQVPIVQTEMDLAAVENATKAKTRVSAKVEQQPVPQMPQVNAQASATDEGETLAAYSDEIPNTATQANTATDVLKPIASSVSTEKRSVEATVTQVAKVPVPTVEPKSQDKPVSVERPSAPVEQVETDPLEVRKVETKVAAPQQVSVEAEDQAISPRIDRATSTSASKTTEPVRMEVVDQEENAATGNTPKFRVNEPVVSEQAVSARVVEKKVETVNVEVVEQVVAEPVQAKEEQTDGSIAVPQQGSTVSKAQVNAAHVDQPTDVAEQVVSGPVENKETSVDTKVIEQKETTNTDNTPKAETFESVVNERSVPTKPAEKKERSVDVKAVEQQEQTGNRNTPTIKRLESVHIEQPVSEEPAERTDKPAEVKVAGQKETANTVITPKVEKYEPVVNERSVSAKATENKDQSVDVKTVEQKETSNTRNAPQVDTFEPVINQQPASVKTVENKVEIADAKVADQKEQVNSASAPKVEKFEPVVNEPTGSVKPIAQVEQKEEIATRPVTSKDEETHPAEKRIEPNQTLGSTAPASGLSNEANVGELNGKMPVAQANVQATEVVQQVIRQMNGRIKPGTTSMHLQLNPKELGGIEVDMVSSPQGLHVTFFAEQASTGRLLETQLNQLRDSLVDSGVQLSGLNIGQHNTQGQKGGGFSQEPNAAPWPNEIFVEESRTGGTETSTTERRFGQASDVDYLV